MLEGSLDQLHLGDLLQWLQMGGLTGRLTLIDGAAERRLDFLEGRVVFASSQVPEERLASWLASEGVLSAADLRRHLGRSLLHKVLFTDILIDEGSVAAAAVRDSIARLAEHIAGHVLRAPRIHFRLDSSYPVRDLLGLDVNLEPNALLMEAARKTDEARRDEAVPADRLLPHSGDAFDEFFWRVLREGVAGGELLAGEQIIDLHGTVRSIMATLAQWLSSSPGLVPMPELQVAPRTRGAGDFVDLDGRPHAAWNQMVLACAVHSDELVRPVTLDELHRAAVAVDLWSDLLADPAWQRPDAGRLDELTASAVSQWARRSMAAAPHLGVEAGTAALAVHLLAVPTDLLLWVLASMPVPHQKLRQALLRRIPQRLGTALARQADLPQAFRGLFDDSHASALGMCLDVARQTLVSAPLWPTTFDPSAGSAVASSRAIKKATRAALDAAAEG
jgi:hypothetical protein